MTALLRLLWAAVTGVIVACIGSGVFLEWCAGKLTPLQKFLARKIDDREAVK